MNQFLSEAGKMLFPLITSIAMRALKSVLNGMWKAFWQTILEGIKEAEVGTGMMVSSRKSML